MSAPADPTRDVPLVLSGYELREEVGRGGFARVHRAEPTGGGDAVAIKIGIRPELLSVLRHEGELLRQLRSPHFVQIIEEAVDADPPYFVLEFCGGGDLRAAMLDAPGERLPPGRVIELITSVLEGMAFAHEEGIVHGDLKPENVLLDGEGRPKIADLGLSRAQRRKKLLLDARVREGDDAPIEPSLATGADGAGRLRGTFDYVAPEVRAGGELSPASDVYALGVLTYELAVGRRPLGLVEPLRVVLARLDPPVDVPAALDRVVGRALARDAERRYPDAGTMLADLAAGEQGIELVAPVAETSIEPTLRGVRPVGDVSFLMTLLVGIMLPAIILFTVIAIDRYGAELDEPLVALLRVALVATPTMLAVLGSLLLDTAARRGR